MSQIWCCLVLSMILGLCGSAMLNKDEVSNQVIGIEKEAVENMHNENKVSQSLDQFQNIFVGKSRNKRNKKANRRSNPNKARQHKRCYTPYNDEAFHYCYYSVRFGNRTDDDERLRYVFFKKLETQQTPYTFEIKYLQRDDKNTTPINYIEVEDPQNPKSDRIYDDDIVITQGGINKTYVTV